MLIALFVFAISCSSDTDSNDSETLQGEIYGSSFKASGGKAVASGDNLSISITNESADCSSNALNYELYITTIVTPEVGSYNNTLVLFYAPGEDEFRNQSGFVEVVAINDDEITVSISANSFTTDNSVEGVFTVPICDN